MFLLRLIRTAMRSLESNFMRSLLATLGVLIGVSSVVACMSILEGASNDIVKRFKSLGSNVLYVFPSSARIEGRTVGQSQTLTLKDIDYLTKELGDEIESIAPEALGSAPVKRFERSETYTIVGTSETYFHINGTKVAKELFGGIDPVGQTVQISGASYRVIGVMEKKGNLGFVNADQTVFIPMEAGLKRFFNRKWLNRLTIAARDASQLEALQKQVKQTLRKAHDLRPGEPDDFDIFNQEEALQNINQAMMIFKVVFYSIAGISLVVGGIGIMNIMLVSVTERTREIGVRMAVGARRGDILIQFLVESLIISLLGGGFGVLLGAMFSDLLERVVVDLFKTEITLKVILASFITATAVGVFSGLYPAYKASRLDPVEALRYE